MNQATPQLRSLARNLIVYETSGRGPAGAEAAETFGIVQKLRPHLANLMGKGGFQALLARALTLARAEVSWLNRIEVDADGALEGLGALRSEIDPADFLEGKVVLLAQSFGLLVALIGPDLTARLLNEIWPKLRPTIALSADSEEQIEKAK